MKVINIAARFGQVEVMKLLVEHGQSIDLSDLNNWGAIDYASYNGHLETVKYIVEMEPNAAKPFADTAMPSAMYIAASRGHFEIVKFLLRHGADLNYKSPVGFTSREIAKKYGYNKVANFLVSDQQYSQNLKKAIQSKNYPKAKKNDE